MNPTIRWLAWAVWVGLIFATAPVGNSLQAWLRTLVGDGVFRLLLLGLLLTAVGAAGVVALRRSGTLDRNRLGWCLTIAAVTGAFVWRLRVLTEPAHLVLYGTLSAITYWALSSRIRDPGIYLAATALVAIVGILEEAFQWLLPKRYWDLHDIGLNVTAAILVQLLIWKGIRPATITGVISALSLRLSFRLAAGAALLLLCCLSNTPSRIDWVATRVPGLSYLGQGLGTRMVEYGYRHDVPAIGRFQSQLTLAELQRADRERGADAAELIRRLGRQDRYHRLQVFYPPHKAPFVFEAGGHLFVRDRYRQRARTQTDEAKRQRLITAAYRETLILESYFPATVAHLGETLRPEARRRLQEQQQPNAPFTSEVSNWFLTSFTEIQARWTLLAVLIALGLADRAVAQRASGDTDRVASDQELGYD